MSKMITLTDEQYRTIELAARSRGQTPDALLAELIDGLRDPRRNPRYYETDAWLRHPGMSAESIQRIDSAIRSEAECPYDADA
jgi:hypothetical protein